MIPTARATLECFHSAMTSNMRVKLEISLRSRYMTRFAQLSALADCKTLITQH